MKPPLLLPLILGATAFAGGLTLARAFLPEWRGEPLRPEAFYRARFADVARLAGLPPSTRQVRVDLQVVAVPAASGGRARGAQVVRVEQLRPAPAAWTAGDSGIGEQRLRVDFSPAGEAAGLEVRPAGIPNLLGSGDSPAVQELPRWLALLLRPGETVRERTPDLLAIAGGAAPALLRVEKGNGSLELSRLPAAPAGAPVALSWRKIQERTALFLGPVGFLTFFVLGARRRLTLRNGLWLGMASAAAMLVTARELAVEAPMMTAIRLGGSLVAVAGAFFLWSAGESLLRVVDPAFTTSLDALRFGRLGPRGGRALVGGWAAGAALAGLGLALAAALEIWGGGRADASVVVPGLSLDNPVTRAAWLAAGVLLLAALARRFAGARPWVPALAVPLAAVALGPVPAVGPAAGILANLAVAGALVLLLHRLGAAALLAAALVATCLPHAAFAAFHAAFLPASLAALSALLLGLLGAGFVALGRPPERELARLAPPAFVRRLADERRLELELELLRRFQLGLLPRDEEQPRLPGWEIAARSLVAHEAGGDFFDFFVDDGGHLWVAEGDVSGHGSSCAIGQAMALAALAALVRTEATPAGVLDAIDRVLRRAGIARQFTTLALLKLDPGSGSGLLANGGHPPPLLVKPGQPVKELLEMGQPPLGQGPRRTYRDLPVAIPPGAALVFATDGLSEAFGADGEPYAVRPALAAAALSRSAEQILVRVLSDWQSARDKGALEDDTTIVVLRRRGPHDA